MDKNKVVCFLENKGEETFIIPKGSMKHAFSRAKAHQKLDEFLDKGYGIEFRIIDNNNIRGNRYKDNEDKE